MPAPRPAESIRWYALQSKPKQEARAEANLRGWGIETLVPKVRDFRLLSSGARSCRVTPLFPNYLFARFDAIAMIMKVQFTRGIHRVVGFGECATPVDDTIIALIRSRIGDDGFVRPLDLHAGDIVEIVDGPLRSLRGVFERHLHASDRVQILLTTIGCQARVQVDRTAIQRSARSVA